MTVGLVTQSEAMGLATDRYAIVDTAPFIRQNHRNEILLILGAKC